MVPPGDRVDATQSGRVEHDRRTARIGEQDDVERELVLVDHLDDVPAEREPARDRGGERVAAREQLLGGVAIHPGRMNLDTHAREADCQ